MQSVPPGKSSGSVPGPLAMLIVVACAIYQLFPLDFVPDPIPIAGSLDDLVAFIVGVSTAKNLKRE